MTYIRCLTIATPSCVCKIDCSSFACYEDEEGVSSNYLCHFTFTEEEEDKILGPWQPWASKIVSWASSFWQCFILNSLQSVLKNPKFEDFNCNCIIVHGTSGHHKILAFGQVEIFRYVTSWMQIHIHFSFNTRQNETETIQHVKDQVPGSLCVCAHPIRDGITM